MFTSIDGKVTSHLSQKQDESASFQNGTQVPQLEPHRASTAPKQHGYSFRGAEPRATHGRAVNAAAAAAVAVFGISQKIHLQQVSEAVGPIPMYLFN